MAAQFQLAFLGWHEETFDFVEPEQPGYAWTLDSESDSDSTTSTSETIRTWFTTFMYGTQRTSEGSVLSMETVPGAQVPPVDLAEDRSTSSHSTSEDRGPGPAAGGLQVDREAVETRKQLLERRRKESESDEVAVALAPVMKIQVPFVFYPDQFRRFREIFPRVTPDFGLAYTHHDHPVAHVATMVGTRKLQQYLQPGEQCLDLHGNPNGNEQYNFFQRRRTEKRPWLPAPPHISTLVEHKTAADYVREKTKWGSEFGPDGKRRWQKMPISMIQPGAFDVFLSVHTLYYYSMYDVAHLLTNNPKARLHALVNHSPEHSGKLYGELSFSKSGGVTTQVSPNGETYKHPDIDAWFQTQSFKPITPSMAGISWTSTCIGGPLYILTITHCPNDVARFQPYEPPSAPALTVGHGSAYFGWVRFGDTNVQLRITNHALASSLRHFMTLRDRANPDTLADLAVKARRVTSPDIVKGTREFEVNDGELADHIVYAYLVDAPGELEILEGVKLLRGSLLTPHSVALKLDGPDNVHSWLKSTWLYKHCVTNPNPPGGLTGRKTDRKLGLLERPTPRSGGLLPPKRT